MSYTYPIRRLSGKLTPEQLQLLLSKPELVARRTAQLADQKFLGDFLLANRRDAVGGVILYPDGFESPFAGENPQTIAPGGEYPLLVMDEGTLQAAQTAKTGFGSIIQDEKISREGQSVVDSALTKLTNQVVQAADDAAWGVIQSKVVDTFASPAWTDPGAITKAVLQAKANRESLKLGISPDTVALSGMAWAAVMAAFLNAGLLPRESENAILADTLPQNVLGVTWVTSPTIRGNDPWLFDRTLLGANAFEKIESPEFKSSGSSDVETAVTRRPENDGWLLRVRRVAVPVVEVPQAGLRITGTGLA